MALDSRLTQELRSLLLDQRVATLGTLNQDGTPMVSMVPFAIARTEGCIVIHVSGLAAHSANLLARPSVSLLVMRPELPGAPVHALPRATLQGSAAVLVRESAAWDTCRTAYLARFPEAEPMTTLGDFMFIAIQLQGARQIAGFGAARSVDADELMRLLADGNEARL
jgi:putative heme iron utilization protein